MQTEITVTFNIEDYMEIFDLNAPEAEMLMESHLDNGFEDYIQSVLFSQFVLHAKYFTLLIEREERDER